MKEISLQPGRRPLDPIPRLFDSRSHVAYPLLAALLALATMFAFSAVGG